MSKVKDGQWRWAGLGIVLLGLTGCGGEEVQGSCDPDDGGLDVPEGFCAQMVAEGVGTARHLVVDDNGDLYVALRRVVNGGGIVTLRDTDGDGRMDQEHRFADASGTGMALDRERNWLYFGTPTAVVRFVLKAAGLGPQGGLETVVSGFPQQAQHAAKSLALDGEGALYVNVGAPSNACQQRSRTPGSTGHDPCPQLEAQAGIWRYDATATDQRHHPEARFASGIRNAVAVDWNASAQALYAVQHGRDQLHELWPDLYSVEENAELPAEEMFRVEAGDNFGWPYCYYDPRQGKKVLAPEYGGDGQAVGRCGQFKNPAVAFPAHWAPNDLLFYDGQAFPEGYRNGAFIAFHGSWNRAPLEQAGYKVVFLPMDDQGRISGDYRTFADGFAGADPVRSPSDAQYRPMGLAQGPTGELYIVDSVRGRIWRVEYQR